MKQVEEEQFFKYKVSWFAKLACWLSQIISQVTNLVFFHYVS